MKHSPLFSFIEARTARGADHHPAPAERATGNSGPMRGILANKHERNF